MSGSVETPKHQSLFGLWLSPCHTVKIVLRDRKRFKNAYTCFVENVLPQESNDVEAENACSCGDNDQDPDSQTISEKLRTGCKCKQGNCLSSFDKDDIYQLWLTLSELDGNEYDFYRNVQAHQVLG